MTRLLNQHLLEEHVLHLHRRHGRVDAREQFLAQAIDAAGAAQIVDPQLAQIDLEIVDDARHYRLELRRIFRVVELETYRKLQEGRFLGAGTVQVDEEIRQIEENERL